MVEIGYDGILSPSGTGLTTLSGYNVLDAKSELTAMMHGTTLNQVENINGVFNRAARQLLLDIDPQETKRIQSLATAVFPTIYDYDSPADLKGQKIIDIYPSIGRLNWQKLGQTYNQAFDLAKGGIQPGLFTVNFNTATKTIRIATNNNSTKIALNSAGSITGNGTWAIGGTANSLVVNKMTLVNGTNSLNFGVTTGTGTITNSTMTPVDLTGQENQSAISFKFFVPDPTKITNVSFRFGTDSSNYYQSDTMSTNFQGATFFEGWNDIGDLWLNFTQVGTPTLSNIKYLEVSIVASSDATNLQIAQFWSALGIPTDIEYYSKCMFRNDTTGAWQETVLDDSDKINLDTESYNLFLYQAAFLCVQQALGQDAGYDTNLFLQKYSEGLARYKKMYKSEISKPQQMYYSRTFKGYNRDLYTTTNNNI